MKRTIKEVFDYRQMIISMVRRDLRGRYKGSFLGFLWNFINPLLQLVVYTLIFGFIFKQDIDKFYLYVFCGLIPFIFFQSCLVGGCGSVLDQGALVTKVYYPREVLPISYTTSQFVNMLYCFVIVIVTYIFSAFFSTSGGGMHVVYPLVSPEGGAFSFLPILSLPLLFIIEYVLCLGVVMFLSAVTPYVRDIKQVANVIGMVWMFATPVMWKLSITIGGPTSARYLKWGWVFKYLNPMGGLVEGYHNILWAGKWPDWSWLIGPACWAIVAIVVGYITFEKCKKRFAEVM